MMPACNREQIQTHISFFASSRNSSLGGRRCDRAVPPHATLKRCHLFPFGSPHSRHVHTCSFITHRHADVEGVELHPLEHLPRRLLRGSARRGRGRRGGAPGSDAHEAIAAHLSARSDRPGVGTHTSNTQARRARRKSQFVKRRREAATDARALRTLVRRPFPSEPKTTMVGRVTLKALHATEGRSGSPSASAPTTAAWKWNGRQNTNQSRSQRLGRGVRFSCWRDAAERRRCAPAQPLTEHAARNCGRFLALWTGSTSIAPEDALLTTGDSGAELRWHVTTPAAPRYSAERKMAPKFCGSLTSSSATHTGGGKPAGWVGSRKRLRFQ